MLPKMIIDKKAQKLRSNLLIASVVAGFLSYGFFNAGDTGLGLLAAIALGLLLGAASKVRVKKHYQGGAGFYR